MLKKSQRIPLWLPYTNTITVKKDELWFDYKGGELKIPYRRIHSIMFYGGVCPLEEKFLDVCVRKKIPVCIHRRNVSKAVWVVGSFTTSTDDILTKQIIFRGNKRKSVHISRKLLIAKFKSMFWCYGNDLMPSLTKLKRAQSIDELRIIEAIHARKYWDRYYRGLGFSHSQRRVRGDELGDILNAVSKLISGVMLRWVIYHNLSPYHGFLHVPVDYPSLIYDLMEPYRGYIEQEVWQTYNEIHETHKSKTDLTAIVIKTSRVVS